MKKNLPPREFDGLVHELSTVHAYGWVLKRDRPEQRFDIEVFLRRTGEILARGRADQFSHDLSAKLGGGGDYAFWVRFARALTRAEQADAAVRVVGHARTVDLVGGVGTSYEPLLHVAMDIVDKCNLRCPFCLYDYRHVHKTNQMSRETIQAALRFLPYTKDGNFWFSCLHEPSLHPDFVAYIDMVPPEYRRKIFFSTNLARRMPAGYFDWLAESGLHHVNISLESRDPLVYERLRKGARHAIFQENWDSLSEASRRSANPTPIRYIAMAYKSNLRELPELARYLLQERQADHVEIRFTWDVPHLPPDFRAEEFLEPADWDWLARELADLPANRLGLVTPASEEAKEVPVQSTQVLPGRVMFRLSWDGQLKVVGVLKASRGGTALEHTLLETNIRDIGDPAAFFEQLETARQSAAAAV